MTQHLEQRANFRPSNWLNVTQDVQVNAMRAVNYGQPLSDDLRPVRGGMTELVSHYRTTPMLNAFTKLRWMLGNHRAVRSCAIRH